MSCVVFKVDFVFFLLQFQFFLRQSHNEAESFPGAPVRLRVWSDGRQILFYQFLQKSTTCFTLILIIKKFVTPSRFIIFLCERISKKTLFFLKWQKTVIRVPMPIQIQYFRLCLVSLLYKEKIFLSFFFDFIYTLYR